MSFIAPLLIAAVQVCWTAPTQNVDGSPLTDLAGYKIFWGDASRDYNAGLVDIQDPTATCYDISPAVGDWYVAMTAYNTSGTSSAFSNEVVKTVSQVNPIPQEPNQLAVVDDPAYIITQAITGGVGKLILLEVGRIKADTACDANVAIRDDNGVEAWKVPNDSVTPYNPTQQIVVAFSRCGN